MKCHPRRQHGNLGACAGRWRCVAGAVRSAYAFIKAHRDHYSLQMKQSAVVLVVVRDKRRSAGRRATGSSGLSRKDRDSAWRRIPRVVGNFGSMRAAAQGRAQSSGSRSVMLVAGARSRQYRLTSTYQSDSTLWPPDQHCPRWAFIPRDDQSEFRLARRSYGHPEYSSAFCIPPGIDSTTGGHPPFS